MSLSRRNFLRNSLVGTVGASSLVNYVARAEGIRTPAGTTGALEPPVKTRMFWTWDHTTEWWLNKVGSQTIGAANYYGRNEQMFIEDYTRLINWSGKHNVDTVLIWGFLRDSHGGVEAAKKLYDVAEKNGVSVISGVGLNAYGGVYYEGSSKYSLENHLKKYPELNALYPDDKTILKLGRGPYTPAGGAHACPSRKENQEFIAESLQWLFKNVPVHGVSLESGDTGVCKCELCRERRQYPVRNASWEDMALMYPLAARAVRSVKSDAMIWCETYSNPTPYVPKDGHNHPNFGEGKPEWADECLAKFPDGAMVQWNCDHYVSPKNTLEWTDAGRVKDGRLRHIMRAHFGTYWGGIRGELAIDWIADMIQKSMSHGFQATALFGTVTPFNAGTELNYLAFENFGSKSNPKASLDVFLRDVAGPLLGGEEAARDFLRFSRLRSEPSKIPAALNKIYKRIGDLESDTGRRWAWLANFLASFIYPE